jgi:hypothetical protein
MSLIRFDYVLTPPLPVCLYYLHLLYGTFHLVFSFFLPSFFSLTSFMGVVRLEMEFIYSGLSKLLKPAIRIENSS